MNHPRRKVSPAFETPYARWAVAWLGGPVIGVVNGTARELLYGDRLGERTAHQVSAVALAGVLGGYVFVIERRWPIPTARGAAAIGAMWVGMTAAFEFGFTPEILGDGA